MRHLALSPIFGELFFLVFRDEIDIKINDGRFEDTFLFFWFLIFGIEKCMTQVKSITRV
jgi:hypothetical protein